MLSLAEYLLADKSRLEPGPAVGHPPFWQRPLPSFPGRGPVGNTDGQGRQLMVETGKLPGLALISYLVKNAGVFAVERRFGSDVVSQHSPLLRVGMLLATVESPIPQTVYPHVARAWATQNYRSHRRPFLRSVELAIFGYGVGAVVVWLLTPVLMPLWLGLQGYLGPQLPALVLLMYGILVSNAAFSTPVLANVGNAFISPSLLNLVLVLVIMRPLSKWLHVNDVRIGMLTESFAPAICAAYSSWELSLKHNRVPASPANGNAIGNQP